jgi:molybdopterin synthase catalytic subunit
VGTSYVPDDTVLAEGDEVSLLPPVSGGAPEDDPGPEPDPDRALARGVFELASAALDPEACRRRAAHPSCGAVCVFTGTTRDTNRGRAVTRLEYEAFAGMTGPEMERIFARCLEEHPEAGLRMLCQHRVGVVGVGEPSVVIAVASPHRDAAFRAARFLIDELKASLPIWKKEHYEDGAHWIGERS